jgi:hypothetical protein
MEAHTSKLIGFTWQQKSPALKIAAGIKTFVLCTFIWVFFRADSFDKAVAVFSALKNNAYNGIEWPTMAFPLFLICLSLVFDVLLYNKRIDVWMEGLKMPWRWALYTGLLFLLFALSGTQKFSFIYFQF